MENMHVDVRVRRADGGIHWIRVIFAVKRREKHLGIGQMLT